MSASPTPPGDSAPDLPWGSHSQMQTLLLMTATAVGLYLCLAMILPFLSAMAWALALAVLLAPVQRWLERRLRNAAAAALVAVALACVIVVIPSILVIEQLVSQAATGMVLIDGKVSSGEWRQTLQAQPQLAAVAARIESQFDLPGAAKSLSVWLSGTAGSLVQGSMLQLVELVLTFYLLFFMLRDRYPVRGALRALSPLSGAQMNKLFGRVADTIFATVYGTLLVSAAQGLLGGLMFWWLGLPEPLLWGVVMAVLSVVPVLGAFVVWAPAVLFLLVQGHWGQALILLLWGMLVVGTVDNLLRPVLVGNRLKLHTVLAFLSVVGGLLLFGAAGLILGPVTLTITDELLDLWRRRAAAEADEAELAALERQ